MENLKEILKTLEDSEYREFNKKLCPDTNKKMIGIRIPEMRKIAKKTVKENDWKESLEALDDEYFEELIVQGFIIRICKV